MTCYHCGKPKVFEERPTPPRLKERAQQKSRPSPQQTPLSKTTWISVMHHTDDTGGGDLREFCAEECYQAERRGDPKPEVKEEHKWAHALVKLSEEQRARAEIEQYALQLETERDELVRIAQDSQSVAHEQAIRADELSQALEAARTRARMAEGELENARLREQMEVPESP
jgi:hypothetical protein